MILYLSKLRDANLILQKTTEINEVAFWHESETTRVVKQVNLGVYCKLEYGL